MMALATMPGQEAVRDLISISKEIEQEQVRFEKDPESMSADELKKQQEY